jgi:MinD-like ATPase involved in chromosome partitioning or flagellar assembly
MRLDDDFFADATDSDTSQPRPETPAPKQASQGRSATSRASRPRPAPPSASGAAVKLRERLGGAARAAGSPAPREEEPPDPDPRVGRTAAVNGELRPPRPILRSEVHHRDASLLVRLKAWLSDTLTSPAELAEFAEDRRLARLPSTSRTNLIVFVGPRGGVGKTTIARAVGGLLSSARCGTVVLMDADRDYGPAGDLAPDSRRSSKTLSDLLADFDEAPHPPQLRPYLSTLDDGLLILGAPSTRAEMRALTPEHYARALSLLRGADIVLMDCAGGIGDLQEWALRVADQAIVFATPDYVAANNVAKVLSDPDVGLPQRSTLVLNNPRPEGAGDMTAIEQHFARHHLEERVVMPYDQRLRVMLDQGTYDLECLDRGTRVPLKRLAAAVGEGLR